MDVSCDQSLFAKRRIRVRVALYEKLPPFHFREDGLKLPELFWKETPETEPALPHPRHLAPDRAHNIIPSINPSVHDNIPDESDTDSDDTASGAGLSGRNQLSTENKRPRLDSPLHVPQKKRKTSIHERSHGSDDRQRILQPQRPRRLIGDGRPQWTFLDGVIPMKEHWNGIQLTVLESEARYICEYCLDNSDNPPRSLKGASQHRAACPHNPHKDSHSSEHNRLYGEGRRKWEGKKLTGLECTNVNTVRGTRVACRACKRFKPREYRTWAKESGFRCHWQYCIYNCDNIDPITASRIYPEMIQRSQLKVAILPRFSCLCCWLCC